MMSGISGGGGLGPLSSSSLNTPTRTTCLPPLFHPGKVFFLLVKLKVKHMELSIVRRETTGHGVSLYFFVPQAHLHLHIFFHVFAHRRIFLHYPCVSAPVASHTSSSHEPCLVCLKIDDNICTFSPLRTAAIRKCTEVRITPAHRWAQKHSLKSAPQSIFFVANIHNSNVRRAPNNFLIHFLIPNQHP